MEIAIIMPSGRIKKGYKHRGNETWCPKCKQYKENKGFGKGHYCKPCTQNYNNEKYSGRPSRTRSLKSNYGITHEQYDEMFKAQQGVCAICREPEITVDPRTQKTKYLVVDHNHDTREVRGLLCGPCNLALGHMKEDPARIKKLLTYAERIAK